MGNVGILRCLLKASGQSAHPTGRFFGAASSLTAQEQRISDHDSGHTFIHNQVFNLVQSLKVVALNPDVASRECQGQLRVRQGQAHPGFAKIHPQPYGRM